MFVKYDPGNSKRIYEVVTRDKTRIYQVEHLTTLQSSVGIFENDEPPTNV